jgi:hypothetical protein
MILSKELVDVVKNLCLINIIKNSTAQKNALIDIKQKNINIISKKYMGKQKVYNITVEDVHEYLANDIVVKNCDAIRYVINHLYDADSQEFRYYSLGASDDDD